MSNTLMDRLDLANETRIERARLSRMVKVGSLALAEALEEPALRRMLLFDLLMLLPTNLGPRPKVGSKQIRKPTLLASSLFAHLQRSPLTRVEQLTDREKRILDYAYYRYQNGEN